MYATRIARFLNAAMLQLPVAARRHAIFYARHHRLPDMRNPQRFSDKVHWRILKDRRSVLAPTCDKIAMKELAVAAVGTDVRVPRTLWMGTDLRELAHIDLPDRWVLKPAHRTGLVLFGGGPADVDDLVNRTETWLEERNWSKGGEWAYSQAVPRFLVEEFIGDDEAAPVDYKFFVYDGVPRYALVVTNRHTAPKATYYDLEWNRVASSRESTDAPSVERPRDLERMLDIAGRIGKDFDFIRVDLYTVGGETWFGEVTPYPVSGMGQYCPDSFDSDLGRWWELPRS